MRAARQKNSYLRYKGGWEALIVRAACIAVASVALTGAVAWGQDAAPSKAPDAPAADPLPKVRFHKKALSASQLGSPKEDDAEPGNLLYLSPTPAESDAALVRGLLYAVEPAPEEIRILAVEDLALLGDARALNTLALLVFDPNLNVQLAALRAIGAFQTPRSEEILENAVRHPRLPDVMKVKALQALPYQATQTAREFLNETAASARVSASVRSAARLVQQDLQPPYAPSANVPAP
jgi:hypothetical protein